MPDPQAHRIRPHAARRLLGSFVALLVLVGLASSARAADLPEAKKLYQTGDYAGCIAACAAGTENNRWFEGWWLLKVRAELAAGQYPQALATYDKAIESHPFSLPLRWVGVRAMRANNKPNLAATELVQIQGFAERSPRRLDDAAARVAAGRAILEAGGDARLVLDTYYEKAKKDEPRSPEPHLAIGDLALAKHDYALAAEAFAAAVKLDADDPDAHFGLARANEEDPERSAVALARTLAINPRHADALLFRADNLIDREDYAGAEADLKAVLDVDAKHPLAWAYRAVLAHLNNDAKREAECRTAALSTWATNPEVDHLIGRKLSAKYRFAEGEAYQRRALATAPNHRPANVQLCQDLLRLGKDDEGWRRAAEAAEADPYDVVAFNLVTLRDTLAKYRVLKDANFVVRMEPNEADVYGDRVMALLARARQKLAGRYGVTFAGPVAVEIFPKQADFAIRTFGLPGGAGFLGVCFGPVITVNSPASRAATPANWEAVLWHEFCHSVTLAKTRNKMPRWLSEGISVYEERRENAGWGQSMTPQYRRHILDGHATPVSKLSGAFLRPPSAMHLQFAYYQSSMVIEYVAGRFGSDAINRVLTDLGDGVPINVALAKHTEPIEKLDASFAEWFKKEAERLGPESVWAQPELPLDADAAAMAEWNKAHPDNFWGQLGLGRALLAEGKFQAAKAPLTAAAKLWPAAGQAGGPYLLLAAAHRGLGETADERAMLEKHVALDANAVESRLRLAEIAVAANDWPAVRRAAEGVVAVNPLIPGPFALLAKSAEATGDRKAAIAAHRTLLKLDPLDVAGHHYRLAKAMFDDGQLPAARREVLSALEEAPRFREAHALLLQIVAKAGPTSRPTTRPATLPTAGSPATQPEASR